MFFLSASLSVFSQVQDNPVHVLYLNSYDSRMSWPREILKGIEDVLDPDRNNIVLHIEHMDTKEFTSEAYYEAFRDFMAKKYIQTDLSLILCSDNNAFDFLRNNHDVLFPHVPVVFSGVNDFEEWMIDGLPDFTGIAEIISVEDTVDLALKLHPETEEIYIINDYLPTGRAWKRDLEQRLAYLENRVHLNYSGDLPLKELQKKISSLSDKSLILLGVYYSDRDGRFFTYEKSGEQIVSASRVPVYCLVEFNIASGALGGKLIWGYAHGTKMAEIGQRILAGEAPESIPVVKEGLNRFMFNYPQLERYHISLDDLPEESIIVNQSYSLLQEYKTEILVSLVSVVSLIIIAIALFVNVLRKHQVERTLRELSEATWEGIVIHKNGMAIQFNQIFLDMFGIEAEEILGGNMLEKIFPPESRAMVQQRIDENNTDPYEVTARKKNGEEFPVEIRLREIEFKGHPVRVAAIRDLTDQKNMEAQASQSQKLQAIGTLAGGIAHDFNNILSAVVGYSDLGKMISEPDSDFHTYFDNILSAGNRAKELTNQILAFSRQGGGEKVSVNFSAIIKETVGMLKASLPSTIIIEQQISTAVCVKSDPAQLQQLVMNLCTNAGLAMKENGGDLSILLREFYLPQTQTITSFTLKPGSYAELIVRDTGCGMSEETIARIFEPFFTTRVHGGGTGLGLSVVHGIVSQLEGALKVESQLEKGTAFTVYLPSCDKEDLFEKQSPPAVLEGGKEKILFVDDEEVQVKLAEELLRPLGYDVTGLTSSTEAFDLFMKDPGYFDLIIADVTMPELPGDILVEKIRTVRKDLPVLMCTGYSSRVTPEKLKTLGVSHLLMKPLMLRDFAEQIRRALDTFSP